MTSKEFHEENAREVTFGSDAIDVLFDGAIELSEAVAGTLGPNGKNVIIKTHGSYLSTKDGVTVAKETSFLDHRKNLGASVIKEIAGKTAKEAGDGTTTATVIASQILREAKAVIASKPEKSAELKLQIEYAGLRALEILKEELVPKEMTPEKIMDIAMISSNGDQYVSELITQAFLQVGLSGHVGYLPSKKGHTYLEMVKGVKFDKGYTSPLFSTNPETMESELEDPCILITNHDISTVNQILPAIEFCVQNKRPLVLIAESVIGEAASMLLLNHVQRKVASVIVRSPGAGKDKQAFLTDMACVTGGSVWDKNTGHQLTVDTIESIMGRCDKITVSETSTVIIGGKGDEEVIKSRVESIKAEIARNVDSPQVNHLRWRISQLTGGMAMIYIHENTETEMKDTLFRVEDAVEAVKSAGEEGFVPGGGATYLRVSSKLKETEDVRDPGISIMINALAQPITRIAANGGYSDAVVIHNVLENPDPWYGWDARRNEYGMMDEMKIIDPMKVARQAIQNAVGICSLIANTHCIITPPQNLNQ